jgi:two-component system, sensor histidine kinase and response regulator
VACVESPDVIVLDLLLPDVNGFEVCRRLRATQATSTIPIIFLSGDEPSVFKAMSSQECAHVFAILKKRFLEDRTSAE